MKVLNDLLNYNNLKIYQDNDFFCFSLDSVLLVDFIKVKKNCKKIIDLGTGNAVIPMLLSKKLVNNCEIYGIEIQKKIFDLAVDSINYNHLENKIKIVNDDIKNVHNIFNVGIFDLVISNPPYFKYCESSLLNDNLIKTIARHELKITFEELVREASFLLRDDGQFVFVHRPERFIEFIDILKKYRLEPKKIQFVYPNVFKESNMILVECVKNGKSGCKISKPLFVYGLDNEYTEDVKKLLK